MYEIELKAHLENKNQTIQTLKTFANYEGFFHKQDNYFKKQLVTQANADSTCGFDPVTVLFYRLILSDNVF